MPRSKPAPLQLRELDNGHPALALRVPYWFERVGVAVTLVGPRGWHAIHAMPNAISFEIEHGLELARWKYNERSMAEVARSRQSLVTEHAGFSDLFTPVGEGAVRQLLVAGPFLRSRITHSDLVARWQALTGRYAHLADGEFSRYASITLDTVVIDDARLAIFRRLMLAIADVVSGRGNPIELEPALERMTDVLEISPLPSACGTLLTPWSTRIQPGSPPVRRRPTSSPSFR